MASPRKPPPRRPGASSQSAGRSAASSSPQAPRSPARTPGAGNHGAAGGRPGSPARAPRGASRPDARKGPQGARAAAAPARAERGSAAQAGAPAAAKKRKALGPAPVLTTRQRAHLRGLGHHLAPVVQVGKEGLTDALCQAIGVALLRHELIKLRLAESVEGDRHELATEIAARSHAALVQVLGRTLLLFRPRPADEDEDAGTPRPHVTLH